MNDSAPKWKGFTARSAAWGFGCGAGVALVLLLSTTYKQRAKVWDTKSMRVNGVNAEGLMRPDDQMAEATVGTIFTVDLENTTSADITLPRAVTIMQATKGSPALHGSLLKLSKAFLLPAHHTVSISLENDDLCTGKTIPENCYNTYFKNESEIVLFDEDHKYEIHIPIPAFTRLENGDININPLHEE